MSRYEWRNATPKSRHEFIAWFGGTQANEYFDLVDTQDNRSIGTVQQKKHLLDDADKTLIITWWPRIWGSEDRDYSHHPPMDNMQDAMAWVQRNLGLDDSDVDDFKYRWDRNGEYGISILYDTSDDHELGRCVEVEDNRWAVFTHGRGDEPVYPVVGWGIAMDRLVSMLKINPMYVGDVPLWPKVPKNVHVR